LAIRVPALKVLVLKALALSLKVLVLKALAPNLKVSVLKVLAFKALAPKVLALKALALKVLARRALAPRALAFRERHCPAAPALIISRVLVAVRAILSKHLHQRSLAPGPRATVATSGDQGATTRTNHHYYEFIRGCGSNRSGGPHGRVFLWLFTQRGDGNEKREMRNRAAVT
jgi:hypothetical protein